MNPRAVAVSPTKDFKLTITFTNGEEREFDASSLLNFGIFAQLRDPNLFKQVKISFGTIEWPGGLDICPDTL